jgi:hypothetical protein
MQETNYWQGFWRLADPKISLASFVLSIGQINGLLISDYLADTAN